MGSVDDLLLFAGYCGCEDVQVLHPGGRTQIQSGEPNERIRQTIRLGCGQTERECEGVLTLDIGYIGLCPITELLLLRRLDGAIGSEVIRGNQLLSRRLLAVVPQKEVHVKDDFLVIVIHWCSREQHEDHSLRQLDQAF